MEINNKTTSTTLNQHVQITAKAGDITRTLENHVLLSRYMNGIYQVYTCHITSAARLLAFRVPAARRAESVVFFRGIVCFFVTFFYVF